MSSGGRFRPYPEYKTSGVPWLGKIPAAWRVQPLKRVVTFQGGGTPAKDVVAYWHGDIPWVSSKDMKWRKEGATVESLELELVATTATPLPAIGDQRAIVAFLDRETAAIDELVGRKGRLIELLREKRTALITSAVTKGLDTDVPMKDSGVEWLGAIPAHWEAAAFRRLIGRIEQGWSPVAEDRTAGPDEWAVIKLSAISRGRFLAAEHKALPTDLSPDPRYEIRDGDFLLTRANTPDLVGDVCVARGVRRGLMLCDLVYRLRLVSDRISPTYLAYRLSSRHGRYQIESDARGSSQSMVKISHGLIRAWLVVVPPYDEQRAIAAFLDREMATIEALVEKIRDAIDRLRSSVPP